MFMLFSTFGACKFLLYYHKSKHSAGKNYWAVTKWQEEVPAFGSIQQTKRVVQWDFLECELLIGSSKLDRKFRRIRRKNDKKELKNKQVNHWVVLHHNSQTHVGFDKSERKTHKSSQFPRPSCTEMWFEPSYCGATASGN